MPSCPQCGAEHGPDEAACPQCGYDRELEIGAFQGPAIERARKWILAVGVLYVVGALVDYFRLRSEVPDSPFIDTSAITREIMIVVWVQVAVGVLHLAVWRWAKTAPFYASMAALVLYVALSAVTVAVIGPAGLFSLLRVIFLIVLIMAVAAGNKARKLRSA